MGDTFLGGCIGFVEGFLDLPAGKHAATVIRIFYGFMCLDPIRTLPLEGHGAVKEVEIDEEEEPHRTRVSLNASESGKTPLYIFPDRMRIQKGFEPPGACWPVVTPRR